MYIPWLFEDVCNPCGMNAGVDDGAERRDRSSHAAIGREIIHTAHVSEQRQHSNAFGVLT